MLKKSLNIALFLTLAGIGAAQAPKTADTKAGEAMTPRKIVERHIGGVQTGNLEVAVGDYADDAVLMTPPGAFPEGSTSAEPGVAIGKANVRKFVAMLIDKDHFAAAKGMVWRLDPAPEGATVMHWTQLKGTPQQIDGVDIFIVKDGKIIFQVVNMNAPKK